MRIERIAFKAAGNQEFKPGDVTVFVGPNHSGKSQALREIETWLHGDPIRMNVLSEVALNFPIYEELQEWLLKQSWVHEIDSHSIELHCPTFSEATPRTMRINLPDDILGWHKAISKDNVKAHEQVRKRTTSWGTLRLDGSSRFAITEQRPRGDLQLKPVHHLGSLFMNSNGREEWRSLCSETFPGKHPVIDHTSPNLRVRIAKRAPTIEEETAIGKPAVDYHGSATPINNVGDGVRSYTGITSIISSYDWLYLLIDDPEAFLHPPIARKLGRDLGRIARETGRQVFASTHSSYFLQGCLDETHDVTIIRLTYDSNTNEGSASVLDAESTQSYLQHPLIRSTPVLGALFHKAAVVVEGETDRMFYDEMNKTLQTKGRGLHDCLFIATHTRDLVGLVLNPLRQLSIPTAAIVDFDFFWDGGTKWSEVLVAAGFDKQSKQEIDEPVNKIRERIRSLNISRDDLKKHGISILPDDVSEALQGLLRRLEEQGVFCVPVGVLESWFPKLTIEGKRTTWFLKCMEKLKEENVQPSRKRSNRTDAFEFTDRVMYWLDNHTLPVYDETPPFRIGVGTDDLTQESVVGEQNEERLAANVASLMNQDGGTLIIGVKKNGTVIGLDNDMEELELDETKKFKNHIKAILIEFVDEWPLDYAKVVVNTVRDTFICLIETTRTPRPVSVTRRL